MANEKSVDRDANDIDLATMHLAREALSRMHGLAMGLAVGLAQNGRAETMADDSYGEVDKALELLSDLLADRGDADHAGRVSASAS